MLSIGLESNVSLSTFIIFGFLSIEFEQQELINKLKVRIE